MNSRAGLGPLILLLKSYHFNWYAPRLRMSIVQENKGTHGTDPIAVICLRVMILPEAIHD